MSTRTVVCAGDRFITAAALESAVRRRMGADVEVIGVESAWPDEPFGDVDGVREAAGDLGLLREAVTSADAVVTHLAPITREVLAAGSRLAVVGVTRGGPVNVDLDAATELGVPVAFLPGRNLGAVAEFTLGVMIALPRGIGASSRALSAGRWDSQWFRFEETGPELSACTVGLVGAGAVGMRVAELLQALGARVVVHDPHVDAELLRERGLEPVELDVLLASSDIVSLHARLTPQTRHLMNAATFAQMRRGSYLVNTGRGELIDQAALVEALDHGNLAGVATDVFDPEPPDPADPLLSRADVLATPHLAGSSRQVASISARRIADAVATFLEDGTLEHCANPDWADAARGRADQ